MTEIIQHFGYPGIFIIIFLEIALMIFPLPGDTLLFTTGIFAQSGLMSYWLLVFIAFVASTISGHVGYAIGGKIDKKTLTDNRVYKIKEAHLDKTEKFFEKYGVYAIVFSRFVPIVRNFISQIMGIIQYDRKKFFWANLVASIIWPLTVISLGYFLGTMFPDLIVFAEYFMILVLIILLTPVLHEVWSSKKSR